MDQNIINGLFAICGFLGGWVLKILWDAIGDLKKDLRAIETTLPETYVRKDDWRQSLHDLKEDMKEGFRKIDTTLNSIFKKIDIVSKDH